MLSAVGYLVGAGSMTLGIERAGGHLEAVIETPGYDKNAASFRLNRPEVKMDVLELDAESDYFQRYDSVDLIYGNPPCGGVSAITTSRIDSPTNGCMQKWMTMVLKARPIHLLMENGFQLITPRLRPLLTSLTTQLEKAGYYWWTYDIYGHQVGCPQRRHRAFLCATLDKKRLVKRWVEQEDLPPHADRTLSPCGPYLEPLMGLSASPEPQKLADGTVITQHWWSRAKTMVEAGVLAGQARELLARAGRHYKTPYDQLTEEEVRAAIDAGVYWEDCPKQFASHLFRRPTLVRLDEPVGTIISEFNHVHPTQDRLLTMREQALLMGYPLTWQFHSLYPHLIAQGVPAQSTRWACERLQLAVGELRG